MLEVSYDPISWELLGSQCVPFKVEFNLEIGNVAGFGVSLHRVLNVLYLVDMCNDFASCIPFTHSDLDVHMCECIHYLAIMFIFMRAVQET